MFHLYVPSNGVFTPPDTDTDTETNRNGVYGIVWTCSNCTETDINTDSYLVVC